MAFRTWPVLSVCHFQCLVMQLLALALSCSDVTDVNKVRYTVCTTLYITVNCYLRSWLLCILCFCAQHMRTLASVTGCGPGGHKCRHFDMLLAVYPAHACMAAALQRTAGHCQQLSSASRYRSSCCILLMVKDRCFHSTAQQHSRHLVRQGPNLTA